MTPPLTYLRAEVTTGPTMMATGPCRLSRRNEVQVLENRPVTKSGELIEHLASHELTLVSEWDARQVGAQIDQLRSQTIRPSILVEPHSEPAADPALVDLLANRVNRSGWQLRIRMQKKECGR